MKEELHPSEARLLGWFDAELAEPEGAAVEAHLAECAECRIRARRIEELSGAVAEWREAMFQGVLKKSHGGRPGGLQLQQHHERYRHHSRVHRLHPERHV